MLVINFMKKHGFTLLELIIVLLLLGILSGIAVTRFNVNFYPTQNVYTQAKKLRSNLILLQELSQNAFLEITLTQQTANSLLAAWKDENQSVTKEITLTNDVVIELTPETKTDPPVNQLIIKPSGYLQYPSNDGIPVITLSHVKYAKIKNRLVSEGKIIKIKKGE